VRIAQVAPLYESCPPKRYGGTERVVSYLTEELVRLGHEVTLFASGDSETTAKLVAGCPRALWRDPGVRETLPQHVRLMEMVFADVSRFDLIHFHCDYVHLPLLRRLACPSLTTLHGRLDIPEVRSLFEEYSEIPLASISDSQRRPLPGANWQGTVHHGLPRDLHAYSGRSEGYLAFLGRISPEKRLDRAVEIARRSGRRLKIAAKLYPEEDEYYRQMIQPLLVESREFVDFIGEVGGHEKEEFLRKADALLFPIDWPEPFGLVMIEALASGTPVIAWSEGSVPEVIEDGVTGFVVDTISDAVSAVNRLQWLDRRDCRDAFESRFDAARMAEKYVKLYRRLVDRHLEPIGADSRLAKAAIVAGPNAGFNTRVPLHSALLGAGPVV
jgi:glycosyltransferase involved in cell wall biosynthesis